MAPVPGGHPAGSRRTPRQEGRQAMQPSSDATAVAVPGFADRHAHLLQESAGIALTVEPGAVGAFHREVAAAGRTPMDVPEPVPARPLSWLAGRLRAGLARAAAAGLTEVTEMGIRDWRYLDALDALQAAGPLPARLRVYLASGLAAGSSPAEVGGQWVASDRPDRRPTPVRFPPLVGAQRRPLGAAGGGEVLRRRLARAAHLRRGP
jgi:hypothetical protein